MDMDYDADVLVVGGGPAGSSAAYSASEGGLNTLLVEKKEEVGDVACAEALGSYLFPLLPFEIPQDLLKWRADGIQLSTGDTKLVQSGGFYNAWSTERKEFDEWLLKRAEGAGAVVSRGTELVDLDFSGDYSVENVVLEKGEKEVQVNPSYVIAADGVESTVGEILDVREEKEGGIGHVYSWEMENVSMEDPQLEYIYLGDFAPRAYGYVFPKSEDRANVGAGSTKGDKNLEKYFDEFTGEVIDSQVKDAEKIVERSGKAPVKYTIPEWQYGNVLFAGDAANQNFKPYEDGILPAVICGDLAGKAAASDGEKGYEGLVRGKLGTLFEESDEMLDKMFYIDREFEGEKRDLLNLYLFSFLDPDGVDELVDEDPKGIKEGISNRDSWLNGFVDDLVYYAWRSKASITGRA